MPDPGAVRGVLHLTPYVIVRRREVEREGVFQMRKHLQKARPTTKNRVLLLKKQVPGVGAYAAAVWSPASRGVSCRTALCETYAYWHLLVLEYEYQMHCLYT